MREAHLTLKPSKCEYLQQKIRILGFWASSEGKAPKKINHLELSNFPPLRKQKNYKAFWDYVIFIESLLQIMHKCFC